MNGDGENRRRLLARREQGLRGASAEKLSRQRLGAILGPYVIGGLIEGGATPHTLFELCAVPGVFAAIAIWLVARKGSSHVPAALAAEAAKA